MFELLYAIKVILMVVVVVGLCIVGTMSGGLVGLAIAALIARAIFRDL